MEISARTFFCICLVIGLCFNEIVCFVLIWLILSKLKKNSEKYSKNTLRLHFQLTILLAAQLLTPILFIVFPVGTAVYLILIETPSTGFQIKIGLLLLSLYCPVNSALTIVFVGAYRKYTMELIKTVFNSLMKFLGLQQFIPRVHLVTTVTPMTSKQYAC